MNKYIDSCNAKTRLGCSVAPRDKFVLKESDYFLTQTSNDVWECNVATE